MTYFDLLINTGLQLLTLIGGIVVVIGLVSLVCLFLDSLLFPKTSEYQEMKEEYDQVLKELEEQLKREANEIFTRRR